MQNGSDEKQVKIELLIFITELEENYKVFEDIRSGGVNYDISDVKGNLQSLKNSLTKVKTSLSYLPAIQGSKLDKLDLPIDSFVNALDLALTMIVISTQTKPSDIIQVVVGLSNFKIESLMSLVSMIKKAVEKEIKGK